MSKLSLPKNLGKGKPYKLTQDGVRYFDPGHGHEYIPTGLIFSEEFKVLPCSVHINRTYTEELISFLRENGELISDHTTIPSKTPQGMSFDTYDPVFEDDSQGDYKGAFLYKEMIVRFDRVPSKKFKTQTPKQKNLFNITILYKPGTVPCINEFNKFLIDEKLENVIHTIFRDEHGGIRFEPFETRLPKKFELKKYYDPKFEEIHKNILSSLKKQESGLYLLHGEPGTGKTTYIKYLSSQIERDIIYVPVALIEMLSDPSFLPILLKRKHCILVIEDAEKALLSRDPGDASSLVSAILNITDGIMGDVFNIAIIATYNSPRQNIDKALLRKGRLKGEFMFDKLPVEQAQALLDEHKIEFTAKQPMTLAEIFNTTEQDALVTKELREEKRMGFGAL